MKNIKVRLLSTHTAENDDGDVTDFKVGEILNLPEKRARTLIKNRDAVEHDGEDEGVTVSDAPDPDEPDENDTEEERMAKEQRRALRETVESTLKAKGKKAKAKKRKAG